MLSWTQVQIKFKVKKISIYIQSKTNSRKYTFTLELLNSFSLPFKKPRASPETRHIQLS